MSRPSNSMEPSRFTNREGGGGGFRRMSSPLNNFNTSTDLGYSRTFSPPPTPRSTPVRPDRLSLRLRSNSNFKPYSSMAESPSSPYPDSLGSGQPSFMYKSSGHSSSSVDLGSANSRISSPRLAPGSARHSVAAAPSLNSWVPLLDSLGRDAFQMAMESSSVAQQMLRYCEDQGCDQNMDFLMKVCTDGLRSQSIPAAPSDQLTPGADTSIPHGIK
jgi:phototropin